MRAAKRTWTKKSCARLGSPCWIWQGAVNSKGYPSRAVIGENRTELVHRAMLAEHLGAVLPPGLQVHHLCERKLCVNPKHLAAVTQKEHEGAHREIWQERISARWTRIGRLPHSRSEADCVD